MKAEHTPGPWRAINGGPFITSDAGVIARTANSADEVVQYAERVGSLADKANARLIASAPDLLTACKAAVAALSQNKTFEADIAAAKKFLIEAIEKAEGEPQ